MSEIQMRITCAVEPRPGETHDNLESMFEAICDAFYDLDEITDQSIEYYGKSHTLVFDMIFDAQDQLDAVHRGYGFVRSAIHCAGGYTSQWEDMIRALAHQVTQSSPRIHDAAAAELVKA